MWALIQYDWYPFKKRLGNTCMAGTHVEDIWRTLPSTNKVEVFRRNQP